MNKYDKQISEIRKKQADEQEKESKKLIPEYKKEWLGRCFKYRNSYGCDCPGWWLYCRIEDICSVNYISDEPEPNFTTLRFQKCTQNKVEIIPDHFEFRMTDWEEIEQSEFNHEFEEIIEFIEDKL